MVQDAAGTRPALGHLYSIGCGWEVKRFAVFFGGFTTSWNVTSCGPSVVIAVSLPGDVAANLDAYCKANGVRKSAVAAEVLRAWLNRRKGASRRAGVSISSAMARTRPAAYNVCCAGQDAGRPPMAGNRRESVYDRI